MTDEGDADSGMREALEMCFNMAYGTAIDIVEKQPGVSALYVESQAKTVMRAALQATGLFSPSEIDMHVDSITVRNAAERDSS